MRGRRILWVSLAANVGLAILVLQRPQSDGQSRDGTAPASRRDGPEKIYHTNTVVRRLNFTWNQIESPDYTKHIANLREIGCPEATIRDIIVAEINQMFARRRATEVVTAEQQWWRSEPDPEIADAAAGKLQALEDERRALLSALLGPEWESSYYPYPASPDGSALDGPVLGSLAPEVKQAIRAIESRASEQRLAYLEVMQREGGQPDPSELGRLREQTRSELAGVLDERQFEEYVLRHSANAGALREALSGMNVTPEQFRGLFHATDAIDRQLQLMPAPLDSLQAGRFEELQRQREEAFQQALGSEDYAKYKLFQDPMYREVHVAVEGAGATPENIVPLYQINLAAEEERERIRQDLTLTREQKEAELEAVQIVQHDSWRKLLGEESYRRYLQQSNHP